jgi:hypothetical protein
VFPAVAVIPANNVSDSDNIYTPVIRVNDSSAVIDRGSETTMDHSAAAEVDLTNNHPLVESNADDETVAFTQPSEHMMQG